MVTITDKIILLGGYVSGVGDSKDVLALECIDCNWRSIGELQQPRGYLWPFPFQGMLENKICIPIEKVNNTDKNKTKRVHSQAAYLVISDDLDKIAE